MKILILLFSAIAVASLVMNRLRAWHRTQRSHRSECALCAAEIQWNNTEELPLASGSGKMRVCQRCHARHYKINWSTVMLVALGFAILAFVLVGTLI